jgi:hypothetical protein
MTRLVMENQEKSQQMMMTAVESTVEAGKKQADVLTSYLKLFQPSTVDAPSSWQETTDEELSQKGMQEMGFDPTWPEAKQAEWVLANINRIS